MLLCAIAVLAALTLSAGEPGVSIQFDGQIYKVAGWKASEPPTDGWQSIFKVYAGEGDVPMLGAYSVVDGALTFRPRFTPAPGVPTRAVFRDVAVRFDPRNAAPGPSTKVAQVYPTIATLPVNQLKFYIEFSAPMSRGEAWRHLALLDEFGKPVDLPFLEIDQELWDASTKRLTVLFDPGRIKRGVLPLEEVGGALVEGKRYTLVIARNWTDGRGAPLVEEFRKEFRVGAADRSAIEPSSWRITTPAAGSMSPLVIDSGEPLDSALALRLITVRGIDGAASLAKNESEWRFTPAQPWRAGDYSIEIDAALEDLAGNRVGRAFDVDTFERITTRPSRKITSLRFRIERK